MNFDKAFELVIGAEGGYTKDPNDRGNWTGGEIGRGELLGTKYGISASTYGTSLAKQGKTIAGLTVDDAKAIYKRDWWDKMRCDDLPDKFRYPLFSAAINCGMRTAVKWLQQSIGAKDDGAVGADTIKCANTCNIQWSLNGFYERWMDRYNTIVKRDPTQAKYLNGWRNRVEEVKRANG